MSTSAVHRREHVRTTKSGKTHRVKAHTARRLSPPTPLATAAAPGSDVGPAGDPLGDTGEWALRAKAWSQRATEARRSSAWRDQALADLYDARAAICRAGGTAEFPVLQRADGSMVNAELITVGERGAWMVYADGDRSRTGQLTTIVDHTEPGPDYTIGSQTRPAWAKLATKPGTTEATARGRTSVDIYPL